MNKNNANAKVLCKCGCGIEIDARDERGRVKKYVNGHTQRGKKRPDMISIFAKNRKRHIGTEHWNWKGGRIVNSQGYILIHQPLHPNADARGYIREHIIVIEKSLGHFLDRGLQVHHKNLKRDDNHLDNLQVVTPEEHREIHSELIRAAYPRKQCIVCNKTFVVDRSRRKGKHEPKCCSAHCYYISKRKNFTSL